MSIFSEMLSEYIREKEIKVFSLVKYCGIDRSTMYKIINGKRNPPTPELFQKIADFLHLTPVEYQRFEEAWKITLTGHDVYYRRKSVENFISYFPSPASVSIPDQPDFHISEETCRSPQAASTITSRQQLNAHLHHMLLTESGKKSGKIALLLQPDYDFLFGLLSSLNPSGSLKIQHLLCITGKDTFTDQNYLYNLSCLRKIFPLYMAGLDYVPRFFYDQIQSHYHNFNMFPCLILTSDQALMCDPEYKSGILYNSLEIVELLWKEFLSFYDKCSSLFTCAPLFPESPDAYFDILLDTTDQDLFIGIQPESCFTPFFTPSLLNEIFNHDIPYGEKILQSALKAFDNNRRKLLLGKFILYFTEEGIEYFARTGLIEEFPRMFYTPLNPDQRLQLLNAVLSSCQDGAYRILKHPLSHLPANLRLYIRNGQCCISFINNEMEIVLLQILESSFFATFQDYMENMETSCYYTEKESSAIIQRLIDRLHTGEWQ